MMPVHMSALNGYLDCVKKLISHTTGFQVDTTDNIGRTCLHAAACGGSVRMSDVTVVSLLCHVLRVLLNFECTCTYRCCAVCVNASHDALRNRVHRLSGCCMAVFVLQVHRYRGSFGGHRC